jgi:hypothetical protein
VGTCTFVNAANDVVDGAVRVTFRAEIPVRSPAITDDRNSGFDASIYNGHQSVAVLSGTGPLNTDHLVYSCVGGKRENIGPELHEQEVVKELYTIL